MQYQRCLLGLDLKLELIEKKNVIMIPMHLMGIRRKVGPEGLTFLHGMEIEQLLLN